MKTFRFRVMTENMAVEPAPQDSKKITEKKAEELNSYSDGKDVYQVGGEFLKF